MSWPFVSRREYVRAVQVERTWATDILSNKDQVEVELNKSEQIIQAIREIHTPKPQNTTVVDAYAKWYCRGCNRAWPCETWAASAPDYDFPAQLQLEWKTRR